MTRILCAPRRWCLSIKAWLFFTILLKKPQMLVFYSLISLSLWSIIISDNQKSKIKSNCTATANTLYRLYFVVIGVIVLRCSSNFIHSGKGKGNLFYQTNSKQKFLLSRIYVHFSFILFKTLSSALCISSQKSYNVFVTRANLSNLFVKKNYRYLTKVLQK